MFLTLLSPQGTPPPAPQVVLPKVVKPWVKVDGSWKTSKIWVKKQSNWHLTSPGLKISDAWLSSDFINPDYKAAVLADTPTGFWPLTEKREVIVADSFNRPNNASSLGATSQGALGWIAQNGTWGISSNKAYLASNTSQSSAVVNTAVADVDVSADIIPGSSANFGLVFRSIDNNNYLLAFFGFGNIQLFKRDNGSFIGLTGGFPFSITPGSTYQFRIVASGDQLKMFIDGNEVISHTLSSGDQLKYGSATSHGIRIDAGGGGDSGTVFDNFKISVPLNNLLAQDISGSNFDGTYQRLGMIDDANWKSFSAPRFLGGTHDWVSIPANTNLSSHAGSTGSWSFDAMLYDNGSSGHRVILSVSKFPPAEYEVFIYRASGGNIIADITQSDGTSITSITVPKPPDKKWYHFAYTYDRDAAVAKIYIDGVEAGSDTTMSGVSAYTANVWRLGGRGDDSGDRWSGRMSHAAIYPTALSAAEVKRHADAANNIVLPDSYSNFTSTSGWARSGAPSFSGGIESTINISGTDYRVHTFTSSGTLNMLKGGTVEYLVVGGGGAGGSHNNAGLGGGGAGGLLTGSVNLTAGQAITVGAGGVATFNEDGGDGGNSSIGSLFVAIGGGGGAGPIPGNGRSGGSGGGASNWRATYGGAGSGTSGQGYAGGNSDFIGGRGSGGGGAGGAGGDGTNFEAGNGGIGVSSSISGNAVTYAGGGGGGGTGAAGGSGGSGGGGIGATPGRSPGTGAANTGSGGGGGYVSEGGNGGSGIVIVRYAI
jgi:hypothetical protein